MNDINLKIKDKSINLVEIYIGKHINDNIFDNEAPNRPKDLIRR